MHSYIEIDIDMTLPVLVDVIPFNSYSSVLCVITERSLHALKGFFCLPPVVVDRQFAL